MSDKKHKSGYELLKEKNSELEKKVSELFAIVERQQTRISELTADLHLYKREHHEAYEENKHLWDSMGWISRLRYERKYMK